MKNFKLVSNFKPAGDQPQAIDQLIKGIDNGEQFQTLLGVTGSGKTFTMANVIEQVNKPTLIISHNKTLAAQLYSEFKEFFPHNAVEYFVSYYDYYQPEAYIPQTDTYIEKDASINDRLDRLRLAASTSLVSRKDVIVVASVSCIYNIGDPDDYCNFVLHINKEKPISPQALARQLVDIHYERNDNDLKRGTFRIKGDVLDLYPSYSQIVYRFKFFDEEIEEILELEPISLRKLNPLENVGVYPAKHFMVSEDKIKGALGSIEEELQLWLPELKKQGKELEAHRLEKRTHYDMEMLKECGFCHGIENYSRHLTGRPPGARPYCLLDYFSDDYLLIIDESHVTIPQIRGMFNGDQARKQNLVNFGFRLPSCLDNRPLKFDEFEEFKNSEFFVSATPGPYELEKTKGRVIEQIIRPTGLLDPVIEVRPIGGQIDDLIIEVRKRIANKQRTLITTLTKRMSEDLTSFLQDAGIKVAYIHSDVKTIDRTVILQDLRKNKYDVLVGVNLLREGIDLPEVSLVIILDADKEGFLRSETALIQVAGRAARHVEGAVIMYADRMTGSMKRAIDESSRRHQIQAEYNKKHGIIPATIKKDIKDGIEIYAQKPEGIEFDVLEESYEEYEIRQDINKLQKRMIVEANHLNFEKAAQIRDKIEELTQKLI